jgi:hypothetical protein
VKGPGHPYFVLVPRVWLRTYERVWRGSPASLGSKIGEDTSDGASGSVELMNSLFIELDDDQRGVKRERHAGEYTVEYDDGENERTKLNCCKNVESSHLLPPLERPPSQPVDQNSAKAC